MRIVIIGNGVAGMEAALAVREREPAWDITIVSEESDHFFSRTALLYVLAGQMSHRDIEPLERDVYARLRFTRVRARATGLDLPARAVTLGGGQPPLPFDQLLIACGSRARPAPFAGADLHGVGHFVTLQDLDWLEREVHGGPGRGGRPSRPDAHHAVSERGSPYWPREAAAQKRGRTARTGVVIGGGLIGIECVEAVIAANMNVHFFVREEWLWPVALDRAEAAFVAEALSRHGVGVHVGDEVDEIVGDHEGCVTAVRSRKGASVETDVVVVAIGVVPNTEWLASSGLERDPGGGVVVDAGLGTSAEGVFAAGDCAAVPGPDGRRRPETLWYAARAQGRLAARRLLGDCPRTDRGPFYNSAKLMDVEYTAVGEVGRESSGASRWFFEDEGAVRSTARVMVRGDRVVGFSFLGRRWEHTRLVRWIEERRSLPWVLEHLNEASFDTELVPPLIVPAGARALAGAAVG